MKKRMEKKIRTSKAQDLRKARLDVLIRNEDENNLFEKTIENNKGIGKKYLEAVLVAPSVISLRIIQHDLEDEPEISKLNEEKLSFLENNTGKLSLDDFIIVKNPLDQIDEKEILQLLSGKGDNFYPSYFDRLFLGINLNRTKEDILTEVERILDIHLGKKKTRLAWLPKWDLYKKVWDARRQRKNYHVIAKELGLKKDAVRKMYYRAYEIIYQKKFDTANYEKIEIKKEYLKRVCETCPERETCTELCPDVIDFVEQDTAYQRELTGFDTIQ